MFQQLVTNFANFQRNHIIFMYKYLTFKKYYPPGKFRLRQLVARITNFADYQ